MFKRMFFILVCVLTGVSMLSSCGNTAKPDDSGAATTGTDGGPEGLRPVSDRGNDTGSGDDDALFFHYLYRKRLMLPFGVLAKASKCSSKSLTAE